EAGGGLRPHGRGPRPGDDPRGARRAEARDRIAVRGHHHAPVRSGDEPRERAAGVAAARARAAAAERAERDHDQLSRGQRPGRGGRRLSSDPEPSVSSGAPERASDLRRAFDARATSYALWPELASGETRDRVLERLEPVADE